jgi:hypothetical protein
MDKAATNAGPAHRRPRAGVAAEDFALLRRALAGRRPVRSAARTARSSAVSILVIGAAGIPITLIWPSWLGLLTEAGICAIGVIEYIGARRMQRGDVSAAAFLGRNQLAFLGLIVLYCVIQMVTISTAAAQGSLLSADMQSALSQLQGTDSELDHEFRTWAPLATYGFYSLIIALSVCFQGGLAVYYFTRKRHLEAVAAATPAWIQRLFSELRV